VKNRTSGLCLRRVRAAGDGDSTIWNGDFIELLIETPQHSYYQISLDPNGQLVDVDRSIRINDSWKSMVEVRTARAADEWSAVLRIPPAGAMAAEMDPNTGIAGDMPGAENPWYVNVGRARPRGGNRESSAWSPTGGNFHKPRPAAQRAFGKLTVEEKK